MGKKSTQEGIELELRVFHAASWSCSVLAPCAAPLEDAQSSSVRLPRSRSVLRRGAAPCSRPAQLRVAPRWLRLSLRDRSVVAPWSLRPCSMRASLAAPPARNRRARRALAGVCHRMHVARPPMAMALGPPGLHAVGTAAQILQTVQLRLCTGSTASSVLSMCTQEYLQTVFAMLKHFLKS